METEQSSMVIESTTQSSELENKVEETDEIQQKNRTNSKQS